MPIPMQIPAEFLSRVVAGQVVRYGCILKEVSTGQIIGHLKEVGQVGSLLAGAPLNPLAAGVEVVAQLGQWIDTRAQLIQIQQTLQHLQLISTAGAIASVAGLGVSVAGFALVLRRLSRLEQNLDQAMQGLRADVERLHLRLDMLEMGKLRTAQEQLVGARHCTDDGRRAEMLKAADRTFQQHRNTYFSLIRELRPAQQAKLSLAQVREMYGRFFACSLAELEANLLLGDLPQWYFRHGEIRRQLGEVCQMEGKDILRARANARSLITKQEQEDLKQQACFTLDFCRENHDRIATAAEEVRWLERKGLTCDEYLRQLEAAPEEGVVLIPHSGDAG